MSAESEEPIKSHLTTHIEETSIEELRKLYEILLLSSCDDDTRIREIAKKHGIDVDGDSYGVPGIIDLVEQMSEMIPK